MQFTIVCLLLRSSFASLYQNFEQSCNTNIQRNTHAGAADDDCHVCRRGRQRTRGAAVRLCCRSVAGVADSAVRTRVRASTSAAGAEGVSVFYLCVYEDSVKLNLLFHCSNSSSSSRIASRVGDAFVETALRPPATRHCGVSQSVSVGLLVSRVNDN